MDENIIEIMGDSLEKKMDGRYSRKEGNKEQEMSLLDVVEMGKTSSAQLTFSDKRVWKRGWKGEKINMQTVRLSYFPSLSQCSI